MAAEPATALIAQLDQAGIAYELILHQRTLTAAAEAEAVVVQPWKVAKTRVLTTPKGFVRAVLPCGVPEVWGANNRAHLRIRIFRERAPNFDTPARR